MRPMYMRSLIIGGALLQLLALSVSSFAQSCDDDSIESVSDDGSIIVMASGAIFRVDDPTEQVDTALWLPTDDLLICNDAELVNVDEDGERASVVRLR